MSVDRCERSAQEFLRAALQRRTPLHTTHPVVAQVWRSGARQARLARFLATITVHPLDGAALSARSLPSGTRDVVDAHLVAVAVELSEPILTGDVGDVGDVEMVAGSLPTVRPKIYRWP